MVGSGMRFIVRAVAYGFAFSLGAALFKKVQDRIGLGEDKDKDKKPDEPAAIRKDGADDPELQS